MAMLNNQRVNGETNGFRVPKCFLNPRNGLMFLKGRRKRPSEKNLRLVRGFPS
jgi:hypothetical protein